MASKDIIMVIISGIVKVIMADTTTRDIARDITMDTKDTINLVNKEFKAIIKDLVNSALPRFFLYLVAMTKI